MKSLPIIDLALEYKGQVFQATRYFPDTESVELKSTTVNITIPVERLTDQQIEQIVANIKQFAEKKGLLSKKRPGDVRWIEEAVEAAASKAPDNYAVIVIAKRFGEDSGPIRYAATCQREDSMHLLKTLVTAWEGGHFGKHRS